MVTQLIGEIGFKALEDKDIFGFSETAKAGGTMQKMSELVSPIVSNYEPSSFSPFASSVSSVVGSMSTKETNRLTGLGVLSNGMKSALSMSNYR